MNILLDKNFNVKLADFGLSDSIEGKLGSGYETQCFIGTTGCMAPEIHQQTPYQGVVADLFALGVTLFTMHTGTCPFKKALIDDSIYQYIANDDINGFWSIHERIHAAKNNDDGRAT